MTHQTEPLALLRDTEHYLSALHGSVARHDNLAANYGCAGCELRDRITAAVSAAVAPPTDRAAVRHEADWIVEHCPDHGCVEPSTEVCHCEIADRLRRMADETATETPAEDPARIDRLRPEFFDHASVESIDAQIRRAQRQQRHWGNRERTLAILRQTRVMQKEHGEWPAAGARQDGAES